MQHKTAEPVWPGEPVAACSETSNNQLKIDTVYDWLYREYISQHPDPQSMTTMWGSASVRYMNGLNSIQPDEDFGTGEGEGESKRIGFLKAEQIRCPVVPGLSIFYMHNKEGVSTGAYRYTFHKIDEPGTVAFEAIVVCFHVTDNGSDAFVATFVYMPVEFMSVWLDFESECERLQYSRTPDFGEVVVIGGSERSLKPSLEWEDIILDAELKHDILNDVTSFFEKGVGIYTRLKLKPFRKLLLAGIPGTGKTMICTALMLWAVRKGILAIYVSASDKYGSTFAKLHEALNIAERSQLPTLLIVEELDTYLNEEEKARFLNVLDGSEVPINEFGTLMVSTTNYPERIDERVLKRPGRLDRIFIVPEIGNVEEAAAMLKFYLGEYWNEGHAVVAPELIGFPGAFVREVAIYALTLAAYADCPDLPLAYLQQSVEGLKNQIELKDNFLEKNANRSMGLTPAQKRVAYAEPKVAYSVAKRSFR